MIVMGVLHDRVLIVSHPKREGPVEIDGRCMCELLVGLGEVDLVGVEELVGDRLGVTIGSRGLCPVCGRCGEGVWSKGDQPVGLVACRCSVGRCGSGSPARKKPKPLSRSRSLVAAPGSPAPTR